MFNYHFDVILPHKSLLRLILGGHTLYTPVATPLVCSR